jgi:hypothetical protein
LINQYDCASHLINLIVKNGAFNDPSVESLLQISRKIVGHFKHSSLASERLQEIQKAENIPQHTLLQVCGILQVCIL